MLSSELGVQPSSYSCSVRRLWGFVIGLILLAESQDSFRFTVMVACVKSFLKYTLAYSVMWKEKVCYLLDAYRIVLGYLQSCFQNFSDCWSV